MINKTITYKTMAQVTNLKVSYFGNSIFYFFYGVIKIIMLISRF